MILTLKKKPNTTNMNICLDKMSELRENTGIFLLFCLAPCTQLDLTSLGEEDTYLRNSTVNYRISALLVEGTFFTYLPEGPRGSL